MDDPRLPLIVRRLRITGELQDSATVFQRYDPELVEAIKKFQRHFLLEPDGIIGKKTLTALNIPVSELVRKIILNMERWRWLPHRLDGKRIFVNIAGFRLFGTTDEQVEITMPVIVGKVYHKTPVFTGNLRYVEVNPYWNIPDSIAVKEIVPAMQKDPGYLKKHAIRIFKGWAEDAPEINPASINWKAIGQKIKRYRLRQDPGPENALGRIKFIFPNSNNIYLHDTPARRLFTRTTRSFSHGCIRVSKPLHLGAYVLSENKKPLDVEQLSKIIANKQRKIILLDKRLPVHILYQTVRTSPTTGEVFFYPDIYGRDALLSKALFARTPLTQCLYPQ
jgi:murein L,D-transpeptidase YcbB/YkuD